MIQKKLAYIQCQLQTLQRFIGPIQQYKQKQLVQGKQRITQIVGKMHKDVQRKFQKVKRGINSYGTSIDTLPSQDKVNIVTQELEQLKQLAGELDKIEKLLPSLNTDKFSQLKHQYSNMDLLLTASELNISNSNQLQISKPNITTLSQLRNSHRQQMNQLFELNYRVISNLNNKLLLLNTKLQDISQ